MHSFLSWFKKNFFNTILTLVLLTGVGLIAYPTVSNWYNSFHQSYSLMNFVEVLSELDPEVIKTTWASAEVYNRRVQKYGNNWSPSDEWIAAYMDELSVDDKGIMGYIQILKIDVKIPIYHTTDEKILQKGIGHMSGTSLPIGGEGTHAVLSGHRGLPAARLFTDLDKLEVGDKFQLICTACMLIPDFSCI